MNRNVALTIAGSDSSGGAGIQADLKTFMALGVHGCSAITCVTAQNTLGVKRVDALSSDSLLSQISTVFEDFPINSIKTGMLLNQSLIEATYECLSNKKSHKVIDPVMVSRAGSLLLEKNAIDAYQELLFPQADILTPNIYEATILSGQEIREKEDIEYAAKKIIDQGVASVLIKGGGNRNLRGKDYFQSNVNECMWISHPTIKTKDTHGSGCTLAAAITAYLAKGLTLIEAIKKAKDYINKCLNNSLELGEGQGPFWHLS